MVRVELFTLLQAILLYLLWDACPSIEDSSMTTKNDNVAIPFLHKPKKEIVCLCIFMFSCYFKLLNIFEIVL